MAQAKPQKPEIFTPQYWERPDPPPKGDAEARTLYQAVGEALSQWEMVDQGLADLFLVFTCEPSTGEITRHAVRRAYGSIISTAGRREAIRVAADVYFGAPDKKALEIQRGLNDVLKAAELAAKLRDDIAHGIGIVDLEVVTSRNGKVVKEEQFGSFLMPPEYNTGRTHTHIIDHEHPSSAYRARYCYNSSDIERIKLKFWELKSIITRYVEVMGEHVVAARENSRARDALLARIAQISTHPTDRDGNG